VSEREEGRLIFKDFSSRYDNAMFPTSYMAGGSDMAGAQMAFSDPALGHSPDHAAPNVEWRNMYSGELERLRNMTKEQDKEDAPQDWYRMMTMRLRMGMVGLPPFTMGSGDPQQQHQHANNEDIDDSGIMEDDDDEDDD
jgi:hypothetical protein